MTQFKKMLNLTNPPDDAPKPGDQLFDVIILYIQCSEKFMYIMDRLIKFLHPFQIFFQYLAQINQMQFRRKVYIGLHRGVFIGEIVMYPI